MENFPRARILAFHGGKRGEGKSFLAQNLAAALAQIRGNRVLLLDMDLEGRAEHAWRLGLSERPTLAELTPRLHQLDENTLRGLFPRSSAGWELACLANQETQAASIPSPMIMRFLALFRQNYDVVIIDGLLGWDSLTLNLLDAADAILLLCPAELVGLRQASRDIQKYQELKFPAAKIQLVLNRSDQPDALGPQALTPALVGYHVAMALPYDARATEAINHKRELVTLYPHAPWSKKIHELGRALLALPIAAADQTSARATGQQLDAAAVDQQEIKSRIHALLLENDELKQLTTETPRQAAAQNRLREKVESVVTGLLAREAPELTRREERERLAREVVDEALGLGPLEDLIRDPAITEIMVNRLDQIYIEKQGKLEPAARRFISNKQLLTVIERIVAPLGRRIDESQPYVDARLPDGSRVHAIIPPLALKGPTLTIRKFSQKRLTIDDLADLGTISQDMGVFISACVRARQNIIISGGTGSGKTTLLNILAGFIPANERIITIEDAAELNLPQAHVVTLEARPANIEGEGAVSIRELVKNALRMRPDRIVVGECRGGEALDMLQAMNTGHDGSLTTAHANSPQDVLTRLETMVLMSGMDLPMRAIREQISGAIDLIVQQSRMQDGSRKITQVTAISGLQGDKILLQDIFIFQQSGIDRKTGKVKGEFKATGQVPALAAELAKQGIELDMEIFKK